MSQLRQKMICLMEREHYAQKTIRSYVSTVAQYAKFHGKCPSLLYDDHIGQYLDHICEKGVSPSTLNITHSALRWFYSRVMKRAWNDQGFPPSQKREASSPSAKFRRGKSRYQQYQ